LLVISEQILGAFFLAHPVHS